MTTAVDGRRRIFVFFCCMALVSAFVARSGTSVAARATQQPASRAESAERTAVVRGGLAFVDRRLRGLDGNGRSCADCHMLTTTS
jgi:hypothetical protein